MGHNERARVSQLSYDGQVNVTFCTYETPTSDYRETQQGI